MRRMRGFQVTPTARDFEEANKILQEFSDFKDDGNVEPWLWKQQVIASALVRRTRETREKCARRLDGASLELEQEVNSHLRKDGATIMSMPAEVHLYRKAAAIIRSISTEDAK